MIHVAQLSLLVLLLTVLAAPPARAAFSDTGDAIGGNPLPSNVPSPRVVAELAARFEGARTPLSNGDLFLERRWMCREFFTEAGGYSSYRLKSIRLRSYESGILEDALNASPRFFVFSREGLFGDSSQRGGNATEVRVDSHGSLRLAERDRSGRMLSYTVCLAKNRVKD